jgi:hypothetical protein
VGVNSAAMTIGDINSALVVKGNDQGFKGDGAI